MTHDPMVAIHAIGKALYDKHCGEGQLNCYCADRTCIGCPPCSPREGATPKEIAYYEYLASKGSPSPQHLVVASPIPRTTREEPWWAKPKMPFSAPWDASGKGMPVVLFVGMGLSVYGVYVAFFREKR